MMLVASGLIAYFVVWMSNQNRNISASIKSSVDKSTTGISLFVLAFLSVFREGIELIAFILTKVSENAADVAAGTAIGIIMAVAAGILLFKTSVKFNLKIIFKILGLILIFIGADLFGEAQAPDLTAVIVGLICALAIYAVYRFNKKIAIKINSSGLMAAAKDNLSDAWVSS